MRSMTRTVRNAAKHHHEESGGKLTVAIVMRGSAALQF